MQAILITAYKDYNSLLELVYSLNNDFNIYIHLDKKNNFNQQEIENLKSLEIDYLSEKFSINWGGFNHLKSYLDLADVAIENKENKYFHLITGQDFPIKNFNYFNAKFEGNIENRSSYLEYFELPFKGWINGGMERFFYYNFYDLIDAKKNVSIINRITALQKSIKLKRKSLRSGMKLYGGSTYWTLNREHLEYIMNFTKANPKILRRFKYTFCPEELYFQTIIMNSEYKSFIINNNLRYIDWETGRGGHPAILDDSDFSKVKNSDCLFARKLDVRSTSLKKMIKNQILASNLT